MMSCDFSTIPLKTGDSYSGKRPLIYYEQFTAFETTQN